MEWEVWDYIEKHNLPYCQLYEEWNRLGCVVCPKQSLAHRLLSRQRWPKYWEAMYRAGERWFNQERSPIFKNWDEQWKHWFYEKSSINPDQTVMFE